MPWNTEKLTLLLKIIFQKYFNHEKGTYKYDLLHDFFSFWNIFLMSRFKKNLVDCD